MSGAVAMSARKGGAVHRRGGTVFVYAMMIMAATGAGLAVMKPDRASVIAAALTFYLVASSLLTVRRTVADAHWLFATTMLWALATGTLAATFGMQALQRSPARLDGYPAGLYFFFAAVAVTAALLDLRMLLARGIDGLHRMARHLWRMSFTLLVASASFFIGQAKVFPASARNPALLSLPVLAVLLFMIYWLFRILVRRRGA
jgi:uncharacterized membrane protein